MQNLSAINYTRVTPCEALRDKVQAIWFADNVENTAFKEFKVFSDSAAGVALNFAGTLTYRRDGEEASIVRGGIIHGASAKLLRVGFGGPIQAVGIQFYPETGYQFFNLSMNQLAGRLLLADEDKISGINSLFAELEPLWLAEGGLANIVAAIENFLLQLCSSDPAGQINSKVVLAEMVALIAGDESVDVTALSLRFGLSVRDIQRLFKRYIGVTPKAYIRLIRMRSVKNIIASNDFITFTHLAMDSGYFDQSHFVRDFKLLMENTPTEYYRFKQTNSDSSDKH